MVCSKSFSNTRWYMAGLVVHMYIPYGTAINAKVRILNELPTCDILVSLMFCIAKLQVSGTRNECLL